MSSDDSVTGTTAAVSRARALVVACLVVAGTLASCGFGGGGGDSVDKGGFQVESIQERPSLDVVAAEYRELEGRIKEAISGVLPDGRWERFGSDMRPSCRENNGDDDPRALRLVSGPWGLDASPTPQQWEQIRDRVIPLLAEHGFVSMAMDTPVTGGAALKVSGPYEGSVFSISYGKALSLSFRTGCHLP